MAHNSGKHDLKKAKKLVRDLLIPERDFFQVVIVYGLAISLLTLAVPIAVQTLINTVVNTASISAVVTLAVVLFITLCLSGLFSAMRTYVMEKYERHIYARLTAETSVRTLMTNHRYFEGRRNLDITNRYFDIMTFQSNVPPLIVDGFALFLQTVVGFTLVSFYHPMFFVFSVLIILLLSVIWSIWSPGAIATALDLSHAKYASAKWLGDIAASHSFFKSSRHIEYARKKSDHVTDVYIDAHKRHFKYTFAQTIALLLLYALASSSLLGIGGSLVVQEELSIGQLVAAELVLTAIFFGLSRSNIYLKRYYQLCGAADEIGMIFDMPLNEDLTVNPCDIPEDSTLQFNDVRLENEEESYVLDFVVPAGSKYMFFTTNPWLQRTVINLLKKHEQPPKGWIQLAEHDLSEYKNQHLNDQPIVVINKSLIAECTILEYMRMSSPDASLAQIQSAIRQVGLQQRLLQFKDGMDTHLSCLGSPLQPHEFLLLKLAAAIVHQPRIVIITQYFDNLPRHQLIEVMKHVEAQPFTALFFTNNPDIPVFDTCLHLDWTKED